MARVNYRGVTCAYPGCGKPAKCKSLCGGHSTQLRRIGTLRPLRARAPHNSVKPFVAEQIRVRDRDACWTDWPFGRSSGRPTLRHDGRRVLVAPYVLWSVSGQWPTFACHRCDVDECWNPDHLYHGTPASNANDRDLRRRSANQFGAWVRRDLRERKHSA